MLLRSRGFFVLRSRDLCPSLQFRLFSTGNNNVNNKGNRLFENEDDFERRFFGDRGNSADTGFDTLSDGMDSKLKKAAMSFPITDEIWDEDYKFRPDMTFWPATNYTLRDLDLTKPAIRRVPKRNQFETTTKEVLQKADFRVSYDYV
ncbi:hypothetical protein HPP92_002549 [Vanilla planifolia]|uniref:Uncharacterized protein n=1 Tax=Vanilla planifolia TaxID=51239 RepID=A0A835VKP6_VANPL|nr:hypothetical protein HPP92_002549 [Vanilla planifolia]